MKSTLLRSVAASALLAVTLGGCGTVPSQPTWYPMQYYPVFPPAPSTRYAARPAPNDPAMMQMQPPPPAGNGGHSWGRDAAAAGAGAIAGTQFAKRFGGAAAAETGVIAGEVAGAAEAAEGAEALEGLGFLIEDWWLLLL